MMTGLRQDMNRAFTTAGWSRFPDITEPGSHLLTMEFLSTLHVETVGKETKIHFRFFNEFFEMLPKDFSNALGFSKKCILEANTLTDDLEYDHSAWWNEISDELVSSKSSIVSIHNPTLRVLAKYLAMVVFSRADLRLSGLRKRHPRKLPREPTSRSNQEPSTGGRWPDGTPLGRLA